LKEGLLYMYTIKKDRTRRMKERPSGIVLMHAQNLINKKAPITNIVRHSTDEPVWVTWQNYLLNKISIVQQNDQYMKYNLPMHFFEELIDDDYVIYTGLNQYKESWFLSDMAQQRIIEPKFKNALLVVIADNFELDVVPDRIYEQLVQKCLEPLMHQWHLTINNIYYYDEILTEQALDIVLSPDFAYEYHPMRYFNFTKFKMIIDNLYWKYYSSKY